LRDALRREDGVARGRLDPLIAGEEGRAPSMGAAEDGTTTLPRHNCRKEDTDVGAREHLPRRRRPALQGFAGVTEPLEAIDGFSHAYFMVNRETGKGMSITIWDSDEALNASVARADALREKGAEAGGAEIDSVEHYEIGMTVGTPSTA
jgi:hypothetical protein